MVPDDYQPQDLNSPIINYTFKQAKEILESFEGHRKIDTHLGFILKYLNPISGDWAIPTISTHMRLLPEGFQTASYRSSDSTIYNVVEGSGVSKIGDKELRWKKGDVFIAPSWYEQQHQATSRSFIFSYSDRAVQEKLGLWREQRSS